MIHFKSDIHPTAIHGEEGIVSTSLWTQDQKDLVLNYFTVEAAEYFAQCLLTAAKEARLDQDSN